MHNYVRIIISSAFLLLQYPSDELVIREELENIKSICTLLEESLNEK